MIARISMLAVLAVTGCIGGTSTEGAVAALECGGEQVCPDGSVCPDSGRCEAPEGGECACADDADPELCERWLERCQEDRDPDGDGEEDCDPAHERGGVCEELQAWCEEGEARACEIWEHECRDDEAPGECRCDCPDDPQDADANCDCDCDPAEDDACRELGARCEQGEDEACAAWEQECNGDADPDECPCDCANDDRADPDCRCDCDPAGGDLCGELGARCEQGEDEACAAWERECNADAGQDPDVDCEELLDRCAAGNDEACAALEQSCPDADRR